MNPDTYTIQETQLSVGDGHSRYMPDRHSMDNAHYIEHESWNIVGVLLGQLTKEAA